MSYNLGQTLYKLDSKKKIRIWSIDVLDHGTHAEIVTTAGLQDGKQVETVIPISEGKNIGKSNQTDYYTQAVSEALASAELKLRGEYRTSLDSVEHQTLRSGIQAPMLAHKHDPTGEQKGSKTLAKLGLYGKEVHVQPKLDGNRCLIKIEDGKAVMHTRKGDVMPVQLTHVLKDILIHEEPSDTILDGELFSTEMSFNELNGHLKRKESKDEEQLAKIKFHLYDVIKDVGYEERYAYIQKFASDSIHVIPSHKVIATDEALNTFLALFLAEGHEGMMIRTLDAPYENKRSWSLLKMKIFQDEEFEILDIEEDARGGFAGKFIMKLPTPSVDREGNVLTTFKAGISNLTQEEGALMLRNKSDYIGKMATIEYFGVSEYFIPRFPKFKAVRS